MARILVIEDDTRFREMLCRCLEHQGYKVVMASDGKEGVDLYRREPADLIITDVNMPEKAGTEVIFELQKDFPDVRIIAISGGSDHSESYLKDITVLSSVKHVFTKPLNLDKMFEAVKELLNQ
ncbi:MAG: response regulator [Candidatus Omnitrophica bacterium]|nr:response regulator [Candidatus Omnitrophota bacterium]